MGYARTFAGRRPSRRRGPDGGFTLVELMVVVAILTLLATLLIPSLVRILQRAKTLKCLTQLSAIAKAVENYAGSNGGYIPRSCEKEANSPHVLFAAKLLSFVGGPPIPLEKDHDWDYIYKKLKDVNIFRCPAITDEDYVLTYATNAVPFGELGINGNDYPANGTGAEAASQPGRLPGSASEIAYIVEANLDEMLKDEFEKYDIWKPDHMTFNGPDKLETPRSIKSDDGRHQGETTVLFFDGTARIRVIFDGTEIKPNNYSVKMFNPLDRTWDE